MKPRTFLPSQPPLLLPFSANSQRDPPSILQKSGRLLMGAAKPGQPLLHISQRGRKPPPSKRQIGTFSRLSTAGGCPRWRGRGGVRRRLRRGRKGLVAGVVERRMGMGSTYSGLFPPPLYARNIESYFHRLSRRELGKGKNKLCYRRWRPVRTMRVTLSTVHRPYYRTPADMSSCVHSR